MVAIHANGTIHALTLPVGEKRPRAVTGWLHDHIEKGFDLYFAINPLKRLLNKKATKDDVASVTFLFLDIDPPGVPRKPEFRKLPPERQRAVEAEIEIWRRGMLARIANGEMPSGLPAPSCIVDSGRGFWFFWKLVQPLAVDGKDGALTRAAEAYGVAIEKLFESWGAADSCRNVDRIARLPETPNTLSRKWSRALLHEPNAAYSLDAFPQPLAASPPLPPVTPAVGTEATGEEPPEEWVSLIRDGLDADGKPVEDRSKSFFQMICQLRERGWSAARITGLVGRYPNGIGAKYAGRLSEEVRRCFDKARGPIGLDKRDLTLDDFFAFVPRRNYIFAASGEPWPREAVDLRCEPISIGKNEKGEDEFLPASVWLDRHKTVEQMTWAPGKPQVVAHRLVSQGGWRKRQGCHVFNLYLPPRRQPGDPRKASPWLRHVVKVYGKEQARHIIAFLAHRIQRPQEKINHGLVLAGPQGIGKDTIARTREIRRRPLEFRGRVPATTARAGSTAS